MTTFAPRLALGSLLLSFAAATVVASNGTEAPGPPSKYCIELNGFGLPAGYLNLRLIVALEDASATQKVRLKFYKAVKSPNSDEILYVFSMGDWDDVYKVAAIDPEQNQVRRIFTYGSLHYPCPKDS